MPRQATLADTQGTQSADNRPPEQQAGTPEHLGSERPYEGAVPEPDRGRPDEIGSRSSGSSKKGSSGGSSSE
jgi:hypothetical protein